MKRYIRATTDLSDFVIKDGVLRKYTGDKTQVTIPDSVTSIGKEAFYRCSNITSITIPNSVTSIGEGAFSYCKSLTSVNIPKGVTSIERDTFSCCFALKSITIPDSVRSIGVMAFRRSGLTSITIPDSVTSIGTYAFEDATFLNKQTTAVKYAGNWVVDCDDDAESAVIKRGTVGIADYAFDDCSNLTSITIPDSVTNIGVGAFFYCDQLEHVTLPASMSDMSKSELSKIFRKRYEDEKFDEVDEYTDLDDVFEYMLQSCLFDVDSFLHSVEAGIGNDDAPEAVLELGWPEAMDAAIQFIEDNHPELIAEASDYSDAFSEL